MRIFITGGEGLIGSQLINKLLKLNHEIASYDAQLNFIDNPEYFQKCLKLRKKHLNNKGAKHYRGDIRNIDNLAKTVKNFKPDVVVHLAGLPLARVPEHFDEDMLSINMQGTLNIIEVFKRSTAKRFIYTSSSMAYGHFKQTPQSEKFILEPENVYGACKAAGEYFVTLLEKEWVILRPTSVYGFTDCANRVTQILIDRAANNKSGWINRNETLDFTYVEDAAEGFLRAILTKNAAFDTFNISMGEARSTEEYANFIKHNYFPNFEFEIKENPNYHPWRSPLDISKAQKVLKFNPKHNMEVGVKKTIELMNQYGFYN